MDLFRNAEVVSLMSFHGKYLTADNDKETVIQNTNGSSRTAKWTVELVANTDSWIRLKSCYGKYLTASNQPFLSGMKGHKVTQTLPERLDSSVEWEPVRHQGAVKLKTRYGKFLRANRSTPPWRNSVTHSTPYRTKTQEWLLWDVHVLESPSGSTTPSLVDEDAKESIRSEMKDNASVISTTKSSIYSTKAELLFYS